MSERIGFKPRERCAVPRASCLGVMSMAKVTFSALLKSRRPLLLAAVAAIALAYSGGGVAAHDDFSKSAGGPGRNAVIVDIGPAPEHALGVSTSGGEVEATDLLGLAQAVRERLARADDMRPWVRGDRDATYGAVLRVMGELSVAGMRVSVFIDRDIWDRAHAGAGR